MVIVNVVTIAASLGGSDAKACRLGLKVGGHLTLVLHSSFRMYIYYISD